MGKVIRGPLPPEDDLWGGAVGGGGAGSLPEPPPPAAVPVPVGRPTVEQALRMLGAAHAFQPADAGFAHAQIALLKIGHTLQPTAKQRAYKMLTRYQRRLTELGVAFSEIVPPDPDGATVPATPPAAPVAPSAATRSRIYIDDQGRLCSKTPWVLKDVIRAVPGGRYAGKNTGVYHFAATPASAKALFDALAPTGLDYGPEVAELLAAAEGIVAAARFKNAADLPPIPVTKTEAWLHQRQAFWFASEMPAACLDMAMGVGKSKVNVDLIVNSGAQTSLIVCPDRVIGVWPKQFGLHAGREVHVIDPRRETRNGNRKLVPIKDRVDLYDHALHACRCGLPHVILSNYAASAHEPFKSWSLSQRWDYVAYDECHRLKGAGGVWSKWAHSMVRRSDRRLGGTGTLMPQSPLDVYGVFRALDPGIFGISEVSFRRRFAIMGGFEGREVKGYQNEDELADKIASITYRIGADVLDLPDEVPDVTLVGALEDKVFKAYRELENDAYTSIAELIAAGEEIGEAEMSAPNVLVKLLRLQQLTGGHAKTDDGQLMQVSTAKEGILADDLEDIPPSEPVVVFGRFRADLDVIERVAGKLNRRYGELSGRRDDALAHDATLAEGVQVAGIQVQSGGTGIDFTRSAYATYYSLGFSLSDYLQSRARLVRPGQSRPVRFRHLVMAGTVDEVVYEALAAREDVVKRIGDMVRARQQRGL